MDTEKIRKEFGYVGKPKQWQVGFDALLKHMTDYQKEPNKDSLVHCGVKLPPSDEETIEACKWYRCDYEKLSNEDKIMLQNVAINWLICWQRVTLGIKKAT